MALDLKIHSFNAGVWSPHLDGRSDLEKYYSACRMMDNMIPLPYGDAERRPGTYFAVELKDSSKKARLIPFQYSTEQTYILEYGDQYIRFCKDRGQILTGTGTEDLSAIGNIVGHWLLNDNLATQVVLDDDGGTYNGATVTNNTEDLHKAGKVGSGCLNLAGADAVEVNDAAGLSFDDSGDNPFSITAWTRVTTTGTRQTILSKWKSGSLREYRLSLDSSKKLELALCDDSKELSASRVAHWKLNDNAANTAVDDDVAAVPHDGVATTNTENLHITGKVGSGCFDLDGQYAVEVNDHAALSFDDTSDESFSIAAWVYVTHTGSAQRILGKWQADIREWIFQLTTANKLEMWLYDEVDDKPAYRTSDDALTEGWHFVVMVYDNADASWTAATAANFITLYVDGTAVDSTASNDSDYSGMTASAIKVTIGASYSAVPALQYFWADKIDNVALFNKALSVTDVAFLYNSGIGTEDLEGTFPYRVSDDALTEGWHFVAATYDSTGGSTAADGIVLFVDGAAVDSTAHNESTYVAMENTATKLRIGASESGAAAIENVWADKIDEVALFSEHLTAVQIASLYSTGAYEVSSSYLEADLFGLQRVQSADVLYNVHGSYPPSKLMRYAHDDWELADIVFDWPPFLDENDTDITITPTGTGAAPLVVGVSVVLTASSAIFTSDHVDSYWLIKHPRTADETVAPNKVTSTEADGFFDAAGEVSGNLKDVKGSWRFRTNGAWTGQLVIERSYDDGTTWHTLGEAYTSQDDQNFNVAGNEELGDAWLRARAVDPPGTLAWANETIPTLSVERFYHYGIVKITAFTSSTVVTAEVIRAINSESATKLWSEGAWSDERGYPVTSEFFDGRQYYAGTRYKPLNIWGSRIDDYENMGIGTLDDDPVKFAVDSGMQNIIRWLVGQEILLIGTSGGEWKLGSSDPAEGITPTSPIRPRKQTTYGSKEIQALLLANVVLFVSGSGTDDKGRAVRGAQYIFEKGEAGGYDAPDYTLFAEHITESGIVGMAYQQKPYPILWAWLDNGNAIGMVFEPGQKVWGWFKLVIDGLVESMAVIPGVTEDEVWLIVNRTINGATKRYIEYFKPRDWGSDQADCFFVDCGLTFNGGDAQAITNITKANPGVVTVDTWLTDGDGNNIADGDQVKIIGVAGMTEVNTKVFTVSNPNVSAKTFELRDKLDTVDIDSTGFTLFNSSITGDIEYDSYTVKNVSAADIAKLAFRTTVSGTGIPSSTTITAINTDSFTMSNKAIITSTSVTITVQGTVMKVEKAFSGLDHLEGKTVSVLGDGSVHADVIVSSGAITLTDYYNKVHAGLPFKSKLMPMKPEIQTQTGSARAKQKRIHQLAFSFYKTLGAKFGPTRGEDTIPFRKTTDSMGSPPPLFTGEKIQTFPGGYEISGDIYVEQTQPLPLTVRSIIARLQIYG